MEAPTKIEPRSLADYLEVMSKAVFQPGMSWRVVEAKWPSIREALREFDPLAVASFTPDDLDRLVSDRRVIRNRRKLEAIVGNARQMLELEERHGSPSTSPLASARDKLRTGSGQTLGIGSRHGDAEGRPPLAESPLATEQGFRRYLRSHSSFDETVADLRKRFRFLGEAGIVYFLRVVGEEVPSYEEWCASRGRTPHPMPH